MLKLAQKYKTCGQKKLLSAAGHHCSNLIGVSEAKQTVELEKKDDGLELPQGEESATLLVSANLESIEIELFKVNTCASTACLQAC